MVGRGGCEGMVWEGTEIVGWARNEMKCRGSIMIVGWMFRGTIMAWAPRIAATRKAESR